MDETVNGRHEKNVTLSILLPPASFRTPFRAPDQEQNERHVRHEDVYQSSFSVMRQNERRGNGT